MAVSNRYPAPLPPTRDIQLLRTQVKDCNGGIQHKDATDKQIDECSKEIDASNKEIDECNREIDAGNKEIDASNKEIDASNKELDAWNNINKFGEKTEAAIEALSEELGGIESLLLTTLVREGGFKYEDQATFEDDSPENSQERYILARHGLIEAYRKCGEECLSSTAFHLAAENMLDLLCLTYSTSRIETERYSYNYMGWMVAGGMDQLALNMICYFHRRRLSPHSLPYLDLSNDEDIEGDDCFKLVREEKSKFDKMWIHDYMLIALVKYKRLRALMVQRQKETATWQAFMTGMDPVMGKKSVISEIRCMTPVIERIKFYTIDENITQRIKKVNSHIIELLSAVHVKNNALIPAIIDPGSISEQGMYFRELVYRNNQIAHWASNAYGYAWKMSPSYIGALKSFLLHDKVIDNFIADEEYSSPSEGFLNESLESESTRPCKEEELDLLDHSNEVSRIHYNQIISEDCRSELWEKSI